MRQNVFASEGRPSPFVYISADFAHDDDVLAEIRSLNPPAVYDEGMQMYQISREQAKGSRILSQLPLQDMLEAQEKYNRALLRNTGRQAEDESQKVWLDYMTPDLFRLLKKDGPMGRDGLKYDPSRNQCWIPASMAREKFWQGVIARHVRRTVVNGAQLVHPGTRPSRGVMALADAMNAPDPSERRRRIAELIPLLCREKLEKEPGCLGDYKQVLLNPSNARKFHISFSERASYVEMFSRTMRAAAAAERKNRRDPDPAALGAAFESMRQQCLAKAGADMKAGLEKRLAKASAARDPRTAAALARTAIMDYASGNAMQCEASMVICKSPRYSFNARGFAAIRSKVEKGLFKDPECGRKVLAMLDACAASCRRSDRIAFSFAKGRQDGETRDFEVFRTALKNVPYVLNECLNRKSLMDEIPRSASREIPRLDGRADPLFLAASPKEQAQLLKDHADKIRLEQQTGFLCVEDTPENRKAFAEWMPKAGDPLAAPPSHQALLDEAAKILSSRGFEFKQPLKTEAWAGDLKDKSRRFIVNLSTGAPRITLFDFNGSKSETVVLGMRNGSERREFTAAEKAEYAGAIIKRERNAAALDAQAKMERAKALRSPVEALSAPSAKAAHPYAFAKQLAVSDFPGIRYDATGKTAAWLEGSRDAHSFAGSLVAPLVNIDGKTVSAQVITPECRKMTASGAPSKGAMFVVGGYEKLKDAKVILVAEGIATAASIQKLSPPGTVVVACMSCGNMCSMSKALAERFPHAGIGIMSDNDVRSAGIDRTNAGLSAAWRASNDLSASRPGVAVTVPPLSTTELKRGLSDFNDAMCRHSYDTDERFAQRQAQCQARVRNAAATALMQHEINASMAEAAERGLEQTLAREQRMKTAARMHYEEMRNAPFEGRDGGSPMMTRS